MSGALSGVAVVDFSWGLPGPMASGQLADHGADVIRVEPPGGDPYRRYVSHAAYDRSKRSIIVDLSTQDGRALTHRLLEHADVLIESWRPGVAETLGLGYPEVADRYPRLVYCSISGYGVVGKDRNRPGYDSLVSARLGAMAEHQVGDGRPIYLGVPIASIGTGLLSVIGIMAALVEREDTGKGQWVETSMLDGALSFMNMFWEGMQNFVEPPKGPTLAGPITRRLVVTAFRCADGEYVGIHTGANGSHARLVECLELSHRIPPASGPREKLVPLSDEEAAIMTEEVPQIFASKLRSHWLNLLQANDVTAVAYLRQTEALTQKQPIHNGTPLRLVDPEFGEVSQIGIAARFSATPGEVRGPAPAAGQETDEIMCELGYTIEEVARLRQAAVVA